MRFKVSQILRQLSKRRPLFCLEKKMGGMKTPLFYILTGLLTFGLFNSNIKAEEDLLKQKIEGIGAQLKTIYLAISQREERKREKNPAPGLS